MDVDATFGLPTYWEVCMGNVNNLTQSGRLWFKAAVVWANV